MDVAVEDQHDVLSPVVLEPPGPPSGIDRAHQRCRLAERGALHRSHRFGSIAPEPEQLPHYGGAVEAALRNIRYVLTATLDDTQRRGTWILMWATTITVVGLTVTGTFLFFLHEPDPEWVDYVPYSDIRPRTNPSTGMEALHGHFADAAAVIVLIGGGWFVYRVVHAVPKVVAGALVVVIITHVTGALTRFNVVFLEGQTPDDVGRGYLQIFGGDMWVMVTDRWDFGPWAARIVTVLHVIALPFLVRAGWRALTRSSAQTVDEARQSPYVGWVRGVDDVDDPTR